MRRSPLLDKAIAAQESHAQAWRIAPGIVGSGVGLTPSGQPGHRSLHHTTGGQPPGDARRRPCPDRRYGDGRGALGDAPLPRPVPIGVSTGLADFATGTLGARVSNGPAVYALSNNHVFAGVNMANIGDPILQPGPIEDGGIGRRRQIGTLADYQQIDFNPGNPNTMDAAIALTTPGDVGTATLPDGYGSPSSTTVAASVGLQVQKYGRTTGFTQGSINAVNVDVDVCYFPLSETICFPGFEAHFVNQFSVPDGAVPFSASGDSGSLLVAQGSNQPVGLLFAGGDNLTIANPIGPVLQRFNVTIDGTPAGPGPPGAPTGLNAIAGDGQVALSWTAPSFDGGSSISNYIVYRGTAPNPTGLLTTIPPGDELHRHECSQRDDLLLQGVRGQHAAAARARSRTRRTRLRSPLSRRRLLGAPLDDFNRADETLSPDIGRTRSSAGETGLNVSSNQLACSVATTCTAWRNNPQFGPDAEVWARLPTLPGLDNLLRLYARLQMPGSAAGYVLRTNQTSGGGEVWLERFNGGA